MYKIRKIDIPTLAFTVTLIYLILGLLLAIVISILKITGLRIPQAQALASLNYSQIILLYPVAYAIGGLVVSIVVGFIYNLVSQLTGGVSVQLEKSSHELKEHSKISKLVSKTTIK